MTNESEDILYEMAEQAWNECWPEQVPYLPNSKVRLRKDYIQWLTTVLANIMEEYDGNCEDIADHLGDFSDKWIEKRAQAILEDAREAEASAREDWMEDR
jgi:hypothetical protein